MSTRPSWRTPFVLFALALALGAGCNKEKESVPNADGSPTAGGRGTGGPGGRMPSEGELLFGQKGCARCHSVGGPAGAESGGPSRKKIGPDLSKVGADPAHTSEWLASFIRNPHGQNPGSKMPKHDEAKISEQEMETLVKYLSSLK